MTAFSSASRQTKLRYVLVSFPGFEELGEMSGVTGCSTVESVDSSLKVSGSMDVDGETFDDRGPIDSMVRIYSETSLPGDDGVERICHATLLVHYPETNVGIKASTKADLYSVLKVLDDAKTTDALTIRSGDGTVGFARSLIEGAGLPVAADDSSHVVAQDHSWEAGTSVLSIVNECLAFAGFESADVDAFGGVILKRYVDPSSRPVSATLSDTGFGGGHIIGARRLDRSNDASSMPNVAIATLSILDSDPETAVARNDDPSSPFSTVSRGREIPVVGTFDELGVSVSEKAQQMLRQAMVATEKYEIEAIWYPLNMGDVVHIDYSRNGIDANCAIAKRSCEYTPLMKTTMVLRRNIDYFEITEER